MKKKRVQALENDWAYDAWTTELSADEKENKKKNDDAWNYLVMACDGEPFDIITSDTETNASIAWTKLKEEYEPSTDEALIDVQEDFVKCKMTSKDEDPALWIDKLKVINKRLGSIDRQFEKGDVEMMSHIMANLPIEYSEVVIVLKVSGIASKTINDLRLAVCDMWKRTLEKKSTEKKSAEQSLNTGHRKFWKKFKGDCGYCGKQGHKKENCFKKKKEDQEKGGGDETHNSEGGDKKKVKNPNIICFRCKQKGHPAFMCPDKDKETDMYAFNFNAEEVNQSKNQECNIWWCEGTATEASEWTQVDASYGDMPYLIVKKPNEEMEGIEYSNHYNVLYASNNKESSVETK
jgi:hypothetical protein